MIQAEDLHFSFGGAPVVRGFSLSVAPGRLAALLGPSGCGKTTLLRLLAGLLSPTSGRILRPESGGDRAGVSLVFQDPRLLPWMTVRGNLEFALEAARIPREEREGRWRPLLAQVGLEGAQDRYPSALSGGMAQRVSLVRGLALSPRCLLLDEPFAAVDPLLRERLQGDLARLLASSDAAAVLVTHDIGEALFLADEVLVLGAGAEILLRLPVAAPHPRSTEWRLSKEFLALERQIRRCLGGIV